jgi:hypothetical protein
VTAFFRVVTRTVTVPVGTVANLATVLL